MLSSLALLLAAALKLVPGVAALRPKRTVDLYGIAIDGPSLALATRHRAVLLALPGGLLGVAAGQMPKRFWRERNLPHSGRVGMTPPRTAVTPSGGEPMVNHDTFER